MHADPYFSPILKTLFQTHQQLLGKDYAAYHGHVHRVYAFCLVLDDAIDPDKLAIAAFFHDWGIWSDDTFDYLDPSESRAIEYLDSRGLQDWKEEIGLMIQNHHKVRVYQGAHSDTVEAFRRADLADLSLGLIRSGLSKDLYQEMVSRFPLAGFHRRILSLGLRHAFRHPLSPLPMFRW